MRYWTVERLAFEEFFAHPFMGAMRYFSFITDFAHVVIQVYNVLATVYVVNQ